MWSGTAPPAASRLIQATDFSRIIVQIRVTPSLMFSGVEAIEMRMWFAHSWPKVFPGATATLLFSSSSSAKSRESMPVAEMSIHAYTVVILKRRRR